MEIYIEDVIISNTLVNAVILKNILCIFKENSNNSVLILSALTGSVISMFYPLLNFDGFLLFLLKILTLYIVVKIYFNKQKTLRIVGFCILFMVFSSVFAGFSLFVGVDNVNSIWLILPFYFISYLLKGLIKNIQNSIKISTYKFKVDFVLNGKKISSIGFLDTGNNLTYNSAPLMVVDIGLMLKFFPKFLGGYGFKLPFEIYDKMEIKSVNSTDKIYITKLDRIVIYNGEKEHIFNDVMVGVNLNNFKDFDMIFPLHSIC